MTVHVLPPRAEAPTDWRASLTRGKGDKLNAHDPGNAALLLANDERWAGHLIYEAFARRLEWRGILPQVEGFTAPQAGAVGNADIAYVRHWFATVEHVSFGKEATAEAMELAGHQHTVHPLKAYFAALAWDGVPRVASWLQTYFGAPDIPAVIGPGLWWLVSAVARVFQPGCQVDHMLVLEGPQGSGKTEALRILGMQWYLGSLPDTRHRDAAAVLDGCWIVEVGELDAFKRAELTHIKNWLTLTRDRFRPAYGRYVVTHDRACVFAGTTNEDTWNKDASGARRQWPILTATIDLDGLRRDRDQLWAEALHLYRTEPRWWPLPHERACLEAEQEARYEDEGWAPRILGWLQDNWTGPTVTSQQILEDCLAIATKDIHGGMKSKVASVLKRAGWARGKRGAAYLDTGKRPREWQRPATTP